MTAQRELLAFTAMALVMLIAIQPTIAAITEEQAAFNRCLTSPTVVEQTACIESLTKPAKKIQEQEAFLSGYLEGMGENPEIYKDIIHTLVTNATLQNETTAAIPQSP